MAALPSSWDYVLHFLLRFLRRLTGNEFCGPSLTCLFADKLVIGSNVSWNPDNEYKWINSPRTSNASVKPFVDWISLERLFTNPGEVGRSILHHLETVAYGPLESRLYTTTDDAWYGNPYLVDFENRQSLEGPWRVPLMAEFVLEHDETDGIDDFFREFKERVSGTTHIDFDFTFTTKQGYAALVTDPEVPINRCTLNWCKVFYTYLLHWALAMRNNSPGARLYLSLKSLLDNKEVSDDTMAVNRALWQALAAFNHPVEMQKALTRSDTFQSPTGYPTRPDTKLPAKAEEKIPVCAPPQTQTHLVKLSPHRSPQSQPLPSTQPPRTQSLSTVAHPSEPLPTTELSDKAKGKRPMRCHSPAGQGSTVNDQLERFISQHPEKAATQSPPKKIRTGTGTQKNVRETPAEVINIQRPTEVSGFQPINAPRTSSRSAKDIRRAPPQETRRFAPVRASSCSYSSESFNSEGNGLKRRQPQRQASQRPTYSLESPPEYESTSRRKRRLSSTDDSDYSPPPYMSGGLT
ncbi:hypothetical protein CGCSCA1_v001952 [Colletotrichum siamense]|nr:hypothetical protein CGCSCA1_v001952 [Colletotrichum siamense]